MKNVTLVVKMFNGSGYITRRQTIAECLLENVPKSLIVNLEKENKATAISWWLEPIIQEINV